MSTRVCTHHECCWGSWIDRGWTRFRVWAPAADQLDLVVAQADGASDCRPLRRAPDGSFIGAFDDLGAGTRYKYRLNGEAVFPDPASRFQPDGVHGASMVVDPSAFAWLHPTPRTRPDDHVFYELHVGTFSPEGTFAGAAARLAHVARLGVTAIELMPIADFAGDRNWGYDGVSLFAPARCYGTPDDLRHLVDEAHGLGLAVFLDVVYNHLGPDGAYVPQFAPEYFSSRHHTPWGAGVNLDGPGSAQVRSFLIGNALHWVHEYRVDGLRLDATHALIDDGPVHLVAELRERVPASCPGRQVAIVAEDERNLRTIVAPRSEGGWELDGVWADDFHHQVRRRMTGDCESYFSDFTGSTADLATTIRQGWFYAGQQSTHLRAPRGTATAGVPLRRFIVCVQNHDQIGNRAFGDRLHHGIDPAAFRAASALLLLAPETPLLFMGQEWAASTPFLYFTDHHEQLGREITAGRRREFEAFADFRDAGRRARIPDPQDEATFLASRLKWEERDGERHAPVLRLYTRLIALRREDAVVSDPSADCGVCAPDNDTVVLRYRSLRGIRLAIVRFGAGTVDLQEEDCGWTPIFSSEQREYAADPAPPIVAAAGGAVRVTFARSGAVMLGGCRTDAG